MRPVSDRRTSSPKNKHSDIAVVAKGAVVIFLGKILGNIIQFVYSVTIARILGTEYFGVYMLAVTTILLADIVGRLGLDGIAARYVSVYAASGDRHKVKSIISRSFKYSFLFSLLVAAALFLTTDLIWESFFSKPEVGGVVRTLVISMPFLVITGIALACVQGFKIMRYIVYCQQIFLPASNLILVLIFYYMGEKLGGVTLAFVISSFMAAFLSIYYLFRSFSNFQHIAPSVEMNEREEVGSEHLIKSSFPLLVAILLTYLIVYSDTLMLGYFRPAEDVGIYNAAIKIATIISLVLISFNGIFAPMIADLHSKNELGRLQELYKFTARWVYTFSLPLFLMIVLFSGDILKIYGSEYAAGETVLMLIAFTYFINSATGGVGMLLVMTGNQMIAMYNSVFVVIFNILANYLLIPEYGMWGAAIASSISIIGYNILMLLEVYVILKLYPYNMKFVKPLLVGGLTFSVIFLLSRAYPMPGFFNLLVYIPVFLILFFWLIYKNSIYEEDRVIINNIKSKLGGDGAE